MTELSIDTKNKRVRVRLELLGEKEPIDVEILRYSLKEKGETTCITIEEVTSSREWLTALSARIWLFPPKLAPS